MNKYSNRCFVFPVEENTNSMKKSKETAAQQAGRS
jgi:hypothetical protein